MMAPMTTRIASRDSRTRSGAAGRRRLGHAAGRAIHGPHYRRDRAHGRVRHRFHRLLGPPLPADPPGHRRDPVRHARHVLSHGAGVHLQGHHLRPPLRAGRGAADHRRCGRRRHGFRQRRGGVCDDDRHRRPVDPGDGDLLPAHRLVSARLSVPFHALPPGRRVSRGARLVPGQEQRRGGERNHDDVGDAARAGRDRHAPEVGAGRVLRCAAARRRQDPAALSHPARIGCAGGRHLPRNALRAGHTPRGSHRSRHPVRGSSGRVRLAAHRVERSRPRGLGRRDLPATGESSP